MNIIDESTREERFVAKLIKDTRKGKINWDIEYENVVIPDSERIVSKPYVATINERKLRLYEYNVKHYKDEYDWDWIERVRLEMIDEENERLYEFPTDYSLYKLLYAVQKANSGADDFMKEFLNE